MSRAECSWRLLPKSYGSWRSLHKRFKQWSERNIWKQLFEKTKIDPDFEYVMIDSTIVRVHASAAGHSKGGFATKIHAAVDALGNPLRFSLTSGQRYDITQADFLTKDFTGKFLLADKGYDSAFLFKMQLQNDLYQLFHQEKTESDQDSMMTFCIKIEIK